MKARCAKLQRILYEEVRLSETIGVGVHGYDGERLELRARLEPNVNVHGVAFGGSIYSTCARSGSGLLVLRLEDKGLNPRLMIAGGEIRYFNPVDQTINAVAGYLMKGHLTSSSVATKRRAKPASRCRYVSNWTTVRRAARFTGDFIALRRLE